MVLLLRDGAVPHINDGKSMGEVKSRKVLILQHQMDAHRQRKYATSRRGAPASLHCRTPVGRVLDLETGDVTIETSELQPSSDARSRSSRLSPLVDRACRRHSGSSAVYLQHGAAVVTLRSHWLPFTRNRRH